MLGIIKYFAVRWGKFLRALHDFKKAYPENEGTIFQCLYGLLLACTEKPWVHMLSKNNRTKDSLERFPDEKLPEAYRAICYASAVYGIEIFFFFFGLLDSILVRLISVLLLPLIVIFDPIQVSIKSLMMKKFVPWFMNDLELRYFERCQVDLFSSKAVTYKAHNHDGSLPSAGIYLDKQWPWYDPNCNGKDKDNNNHGKHNLVNNNHEEHNLINSDSDNSNRKKHARHPTCVLVIAVRGSSDVDDWLTDFNFDIIDSQHPNIGRVHRGIWESTQHIFKRSQVNYNEIKKLVSSEASSIKKVVVTGHSLGGGITVYLTKLLHDKFKEDKIDIPVEGYAFAPPGCVAYDNMLTFSRDENNRTFLWCFAHGIDIVPRASLGSVRELMYRAFSLAKTQKKVPWLTIIFYLFAEFYWLLRWIMTGDYTGITSRATLAFPETRQDLFESKFNQFEKDTLYVPDPAHLLWFHCNRPNEGVIDTIDPEQHLSTIFWSPIDSIFAHTPLHYLKCLNDLQYQYRYKKNKVTNTSNI